MRHTEALNYGFMLTIIRGNIRTNTNIPVKKYVFIGYLLIYGTVCSVFFELRIRILALLVFSFCLLI